MQRIKLLLQHGYLSEAMTLLGQAGDRSSDPSALHGELANLTLQCYIQQMVNGNRGSSDYKKLGVEFRYIYLSIYLASDSSQFSVSLWLTS